MNFKRNSRSEPQAKPRPQASRTAWKDTPGLAPSQGALVVELSDVSVLSFSKRAPCSFKTKQCSILARLEVCQGKRTTKDALPRNLRNRLPKRTKSGDFSTSLLPSPNQAPSPCGLIVPTNKQNLRRCLHQEQGQGVRQWQQLPQKGQQLQQTC